MTAGVVAAVLVTVLGAHAADWRVSGEVPLEGDGTALLVRATVNDTIRGLFLLDSGASVCAISPDLQRRARVAAGDETLTLQTANGLLRAPLVRLRTVSVGGVRAREVQAVVFPDAPPGLDGIIGLSFLNRFSYSIDPRRRVLRLE